MKRWTSLRRHAGRRLATGLMTSVLLLSTAFSGAAAPLNQPEAPPAADQPPPQEALEDPEAAYQPDYLHLATGDLSALEQAPNYAWPYDLLSIGHTMASYQNYGSTPYFHHGIDGRSNVGNPVYATSGGQVVNVENYTPGNDLYWEVAILDPDGFLWQFHHLEVSSIPQAIWDKFAEYQANPATGGFIPANTYIGDVVYWTVITYGERYHHIHLNILDGGGNYLNGFAFLSPLNDTQVPEIQAVGLYQNGAILAGNQVSGTYSLYVRVRDLILHNQFYVPPYDLTVAIDGGPAQTVWRFDNLPGGGDRYAYVSQLFVSPTCGNYSCRDFYIDLGFVPGSARAFPTNGGTHSAVVTARDYAGNETSQTYTWTVVGPPSGTALFFEDFEGGSGYTWTRNPSGTDTATSGLWEVGNPDATSSGGAKQLGVTVSGNNDLVTGRLAGGSASSNDIDGGRTSVRSPNIVLPNSPDLVLSFYSYLAHTTSSSADYFRVTVVGPVTEGSEGGRTPSDTVVWQEVGAGSNRNGAWTYHQADLDAYAGQTIYLLFEAADATPATTVVEAAVDDVQITLSGPLAVTLDHFTAQVGRGHVALEWATVSEMNNLGFNLYRSQSESGARQALGFIPSQAPGSSQGFVYSWRDSDVAPGNTYWYWLEDVDTAGRRTLHGPASVRY